MCFVFVCEFVRRIIQKVVKYYSWISAKSAILVWHLIFIADKWLLGTVHMSRAPCRRKVDTRNHLCVVTLRLQILSINQARAPVHTCACCVFVSGSIISCRVRWNVTAHAKSADRVAMLCKSRPKRRKSICFANHARSSTRRQSHSTDRKMHAINSRAPCHIQT